MQSILDRGEDARLMLVVERIGTRTWRLRCLSGLLTSQRIAAGGACSQSDKAGSCRAEQAATGYRRPARVDGRGRGIGLRLIAKVLSRGHC